MAAPHVSGIAALVWSHFPNHSAKEIRNALQSSVEDLGPKGRYNNFGFGLVNARNAISFLSGETCFSVCVDSPMGWYDDGGSTFNCEWYSKGENFVSVSC